MPAAVRRSRGGLRRVSTPHDFESFDGTRIVYDDEGDGPAVVLLHGFAADAHLNWRAPGVIGPLLAAGCRIVAPDARGHGGSEKPHDPQRYEGGAMARDVTALLDHLAIESCALVGYSMGAITALRVTPNEPRARRLVLGGIGGSILRSRTSAQREAIASALDAAGDDDAPPAARGFRRFAESTGADLRALAACMRGNRIEHQRPSDVSVPTLVLTSAEDELAGSPQELADAIPGASAIFLSGSHLAAVADVRFAPAIVDFVQG